MAKQFYRATKFTSATLELIDTLNEIVEDYMAQGYVLTVRQLYYQMVARGLIENTERSYKRITGVVNDARIAGLIDWDGIEDRTRELVKRTRWKSPADILEAVAKQYHEDMWTGQGHRVYVVVEKEALAGVLEGVCHQYDVPLLAARGYPSGTVLREFSENDLIPCVNNDQVPVILHLGDHDPSGIDMSRDLRERFHMFCTGEYQEGKWLSEKAFKRIALNMPQIEEQQPPENPAKVTDSRFMEYQRRFGDKSWELDALTPEYLTNLVRTNILMHIDDPKAWKAAEKRIDGERKKLLKIAENWK